MNILNKKLSYIRKNMFSICNISGSDKTMELATSVFAILWGLWVLNPFIYSFIDIQLYHIMEKLAPEWIWGLVYFSAGVLMMLAIIYGTLMQRILMSSFILFLFIVLTILTILSNSHSPAGATYIGVSFFACLTQKALVNKFIENKKFLGRQP